MITKYNRVIDNLKESSLSAFKNSKPTSFIFGEVISISPVKIRIDQKLILEQSQLILSRNVTDYEIEMTVDHETENESGGSGYSLFSAHNHGYSGKKTFKVHNSLNVGDNVILGNIVGGQKFIVIDKT